MGYSSSPYWSLFLMTSIYMVGELGHYLVGTVSMAMAKELQYGEMSCQLRPDLEGSNGKLCKDEEDRQKCGDVGLPGGGNSSACSWDYNGLGLEYQILAGPSYILVFAVAGLGWGYLADNYNRVTYLSLSTLLFSIAIVGTSLSTQYWHVVLFRMALAAGESGCNPLASGIIADLFPSTHRGLAMSLFNWGIYVGYGLSYTVGKYVTEADVLGQGWRGSYVVSGIPGVILALLFLLTVTEPVRGDVGGGESTKAPKYEMGEEGPDRSKLTEERPNKEGAWSTLSTSIHTFWAILKKPAVVVLFIGACVRHFAGYTWGYNSALYFQKYYPDYDASWWLMGVSIGAGVVGTATGGYLSDRLVNRLGISSRALVLAVSQLVASPFGFGVLFLDPPYAMISLLIGYVASEMWFGVMFAILVELVPAEIRSQSISVFLFIINNFGGNVPVIVDPIGNALSYRTALTILYPGALFTSSILFFICWRVLKQKEGKD